MVIKKDRIKSLFLTGVVAERLGKTTPIGVIVDRKEVHMYFNGALSVGELKDYLETVTVQSGEYTGKDGRYLFEVSDSRLRVHCDAITNHRLASKESRSHGDERSSLIKAIESGN